MALAFRAQSHLATNAASLVLTEPAGTQQNDILFYFAVKSSVSGAIVADPTGGWSTINTWTGPTNASVTKLYWIRRGASAPGFTLQATGGGGYLEGVVSAWSGAPTTGTPFTSQLSAARHAAAAPDCPAITTTANDSIVIAFGMGFAGWASTGGWTAPAGYADADGGTGSGITNGDVGVKYKAVGTSGALEDPGVFGNLVGGAADEDIAEGTLELLAAANSANLSLPTLGSGIYQPPMGGLFS